MRGVAGEVKQLDLVLLTLHPRPHQFAVTDAQIVQNREDFVACIFNQGLQEFDELVVVKRLVNDHPSCLALPSCVTVAIMDELLTRAPNRHGDGGSSRREALLLRTCSLMPNSYSMRCPTAARFHRLKSILSCSGRLSMAMRWMVSSCAKPSIRPSLLAFPLRAGRIAFQPPASNESMATRTVG